MNPAVVLNSTPLGILCNPRTTVQVSECRQWLDDLLAAGRRVIIPEITDYEIRRELIRRNNIVALTNLDGYGHRLEYLPICTAAIRLAASLWAQARNAGQPTAPDHALDADVILAAQSLSLNSPVVVATSNLRHLSRFVAAELWSNIVP